MSSFQLDKTIFNPTLYARIREIWFQDLKPSDTEIPPSVIKQWFANTPDEKVHFDGVCREAVGRALDSISPSNFPNPNAAPFLQQLEEVVKKEKSEGGDGSEAAKTALSMVLLLDQMPRNLFRTKEDGLANVYTHYDKISLPFLMSFFSSSPLITRPDIHPLWRLSPSYRMWFFLPLVHSEDLAVHDLLDVSFRESKRDMEEGGGSPGLMMFIEKGMESEKEHRDILEKFGRYPHRNEAVGRETTAEEKAFMVEGGASFGVQQEK
ncbi:DUF924-domain-containing protein [Amniculicola lignicola CBS 123094]|uniref:DUF924-domain-containing protein n=1 Tax=Amniculicola lignicola CBS 123094 TaxID=1392246 RepID=A0A6A5W490_9PLEO|nr:DUF924-domain-containing protein [Amniculicola lignicola CBS 123094]